MEQEQKYITTLDISHSQRMGLCINIVQSTLKGFRYLEIHFRKSTWAFYDNEGVDETFFRNYKQKTWELNLYRTLDDFNLNEGLYRVLKRLLLVRKKRIVITPIIDEIIVSTYTNVNVSVDLKWDVSNSTKGYIVIDNTNFDSSSELKTHRVEKHTPIRIEGEIWRVTTINDKKIVLQNIDSWNNELLYKTTCEKNIMKEVKLRRDDISHLCNMRSKENIILEKTFTDDEICCLQKNAAENIINYSKLIGMHTSRINEIVDKHIYSKMFTLVTNTTKNILTIHAQQRTLCPYFMPFLTYIPYKNNVHQITRARRVSSKTIEEVSVQLNIN